MEELTQAVMRTIRETWLELQQTHWQLSGYALCTDDCLMTLAHCASTREFCERKPDYAYLPVEWPLSDYRPWASASGMLAAGEEAATEGEMLAKHVDSSFACLVEALRQVKQEGLFGDDVFLTVLSTDPSEHLEELEEGAVRALNSEAVFEAWYEEMRG